MVSHTRQPSVILSPEGVLEELSRVPPRVVPVAIPFRSVTRRCGAELGVLDPQRLCLIRANSPRWNWGGEGERLKLKRNRVAPAEFVRRLQLLGLAVSVSHNKNLSGSLPNFHIVRDPRLAAFQARRS